MAGETTTTADAHAPPQLPRARDGAEPSAAEVLKPVTRRGRLVPAVQPGALDLQTENGRFELLGLYELEVREGDEVEIDGVPAPLSHSSAAPPGLLVRQIRHLD